MATAAPVLIAVASAGLITSAVAGCARFGYSDRVLQRVPSPDGKIVAVCQEIPVFDGPDKDVRLEHPDGTVIRKLSYLGDASGCDEMIWSQDGQTLAMLTSHVATVYLLDVKWALEHPDVAERHWYSRQFTFSSEQTIKRGTHLRFVGRLELEFQLCPYSIRETQRTRGQIRCTQPPRPQRLRIPSPLVSGRPS